MKTYVGIDCGKRTLDVVRLNPEGKKHQFVKFTTDESGIQLLVKWLTTNDVVGLEAGNQAFRIAKAILKGSQNTETYVLNPGDLAMIYMSLKKTDKEDSLKIARLISRIPKEELPIVPIPSDNEEDQRRLCTEEEFWKNQLTALKNRLHSVFVAAGITTVGRKDLRSKNNREENLKLLSPRFKKEAERISRNIDEIESDLEELEEEVKEQLKDDFAYTNILMSMPGIGPNTALAVKSYLGDFSRFSSGSQVSFYVGLVPRVDISGDTVRYGSVLKRGCHPIRRLIVQAAWALTCSKYGGPLKEFFTRLKARKGAGKAIVAVARKMLEILYSMTKKRELYDNVPLEFIDEKMRRYGLIDKFA